MLSRITLAEKAAQLTAVNWEHTRPYDFRRGERVRIEFTLGPAQLSFYDADLRRTVELGRFEVMIAGSSAGKAQAGFEIVTP